MPSIPPPASDPITLADWLELRAFLADDKNVSAADLRRELVRMGIPEDEESDVETLVDDTFSELEDRSEACRESYPFSLSPSVLQAQENGDHWAYIFCLLLSWLGVGNDRAKGKPTRLFEKVAAVAAKGYVAGESLHFGFPRRTLPSNFIKALEEVCRATGEGSSPRRRSSSQHVKDAGLDIIAWKSFPDKRQAQVMLFGQCAAGKNWEDKLSELQPRSFIDTHLQEAPAVDPLRGFFTPFRLSKRGWYEKAKQAGILFDRCRIAHSAYEQDPPDDIRAWNEATKLKLNRSGG